MKNTVQLATQIGTLFQKFHSDFNSFQHEKQVLEEITESALLDELHKDVTQVIEHTMQLLRRLEAYQSQIAQEQGKF